MAPVFGVVSLARRARTFHPRGVTIHAQAVPHERAAGELSELAARLSGAALLRFSGALWKRAERIPDVLGCALRLRRAASDSELPAADDQDLLFATIRRPWTMPFSPFTTRTRDYLANDYFAVSPFDAGIGQAVYLKLHPAAPPRGAQGTRRERLLARVAEQAVIELHVSQRAFGPWRPLLELRLERAARVDDQALRFSPFRSGRGVRPLGFVHALRAGVYALSQRARPARAQ